MNGTDALLERAVNAADVIAWLQADYRLRSGVDPEVDGGATLSEHITIADWRAACDLVGTRELAPAMNEWFGCDRPIEEWIAILEPQKMRTLGNLARYVAPHMSLADFTPIAIGGRSDAASGAFFALRSILAREGNEIPGLRPSTTIRSLNGNQVIALGFALARLSPSLTPEPAVVPKRRQPIGVIIVLLAFLAMAAGVAVSLSALAWAGAAGIAVGILLSVGPPACIDLGNFTTVGDVARAVAGDRDRIAS